MVKRSSSKRAYKKRRTVRKSRVIRRRKTTRSKRKTLRGGMPNISLGGLSELRDKVKSNASESFKAFTGKFRPADTDKLPISEAQSELSTAENVDANPIEQQAAAAEERKAALKAANIEADTAYEKAKTDRDASKKEVTNNSFITSNDVKTSRIDKAKAAQAAASAAYQVAFDAANAAKDGGVPENEVKYPKT